MKKLWVILSVLDLIGILVFPVVAAVCTIQSDFISPDLLLVWLLIHLGREWMQKKFLFHKWKYEDYIIFYLLLAYFITLILGQLLDSNGILAYYLV